MWSQQAMHWQWRNEVQPRVLLPSKAANKSCSWICWREQFVRNTNLEDQNEEALTTLLRWRRSVVSPTHFKSRHPLAFSDTCKLQERAGESSKLITGIERREQLNYCRRESYSCHGMVHSPRGGQSIPRNQFRFWSNQLSGVVGVLFVVNLLYN